MRQVIHIQQGKGKKDRMVPLSNKVYSFMERAPYKRIKRRQ
jgi:site-specific recombinase XerD